MKRQPTEWDTIFANNASDKKIPKINKLTQLSIQKKKKRANNPAKKWAETLNRHFSKEDIQMANRHMKKCSALLIIKEIQIKTTISPQTCQNGYNQKDLKKNKCWQGCGKKVTPMHFWWRYKLVQSLWKIL